MSRANHRYVALRLDGLQAAGFDRSFASGPHIYPRCSQCQALVVNGIATHESGCPNAVHECRGCDALVPASQRWCEDCAC